MTILLEVLIPKFNKKESELETMYDKWMYVLKNLSALMERPAALQERIFTRLFEQAEIAKFNPEELMQYEDSVNAYRDIFNAINTAKKDSFAEGKAEGRELGKAEGIELGKKLRDIEIARNLLLKGLSVNDIAETTGLSQDDVATLL